VIERNGSGRSHSSFQPLRGDNLCALRLAQPILKLRCNEDTELFLRAGRFGMRMQFDEQLIVWARDHRRLRRGRTRKAAHSFVRNCLLYVMCRWPRLPAFLEDDWGYWSQPA
jgi:hypothetical protein